MALTERALKKWIRNPAAVLPGLFTAAFWLVLFGNSFNPSNLIPSQIAGAALPASVISAIKTDILGQTFGGASDYITYLVAGVISLIIVFNQAFGGIDIVLDKQLGYLDTILAAPISRASIFFSGVAQNFVKAMILSLATFACRARNSRRTHAWTRIQHTLIYRGVRRVLPHSIRFFCNLYCSSFRCEEHRFTCCNRTVCHLATGVHEQRDVSEQWLSLMAPRGSKC